MSTWRVYVPDQQSGQTEEITQLKILYGHHNEVSIVKVTNTIYKSEIPHSFIKLTNNFIDKYCTKFDY